MDKSSSPKKNRSLLTVMLSLLVGLLLGWMLFSSDATESQEVGESEVSQTTWTCSMHPQIRQNEPGQCPICGMDLIPLEASEGGGLGVIELTEEAARIAQIQVQRVGYQQPEKEIILQGKVAVDERRISSQTAHVPGRIERLYVKFTGEPVRRGQQLASIYSPELVNAQKELIQAVKTKEGNPALYQAARKKLQYWKLTENQIDAIESSGEIKQNMSVFAEFSGVVQERHVAEGDYVKEGQVLLTISNLDRVWVDFDAYESDLPWIKMGQELSFHLNALPGQEFTQRVTFIDPEVDSRTRTATVRTELANPGGLLKPQMFAEARVKAKLANRTTQLTVPKTAVLWTGERSVVYVQPLPADKPVYEFREVTIGPDLGDAYVILDGLDEGEYVVVNGVFKVDAAAQLAGKKSMMNAQGGQSSIGHVHDGGAPSGTASEGAQHIPEGSVERAFQVNGNCAMCKSRIEKTATSVDGVISADWSESTKKLKVTLRDDKVNVRDVAKAVAEAGHDNKYFKASGEDYEKLPPCCKYVQE